MKKLLLLTTLFACNSDKAIVIKGERGKEGMSIVGPQGPKGDDGVSVVGPKGDKGDKGDAGNSVVGPAGPQGVTGVNGKDGVDGNDGISIGIVLEAAQNCPNGGTLVRTFIDSNRNQLFDVGETTLQAVELCNQQTQGSQSIIQNQNGGGWTYQVDIHLTNSSNNTYSEWSLTGTVDETSKLDFNCWENGGSVIFVKQGGDFTINESNDLYWRDFKPNSSRTITCQINTLNGTGPKPLKNLMFKLGE